MEAICGVIYEAIVAMETNKTPCGYAKLKVQRKLINPIPPGGGGGGAESARADFNFPGTFLIFKQYLPNVATFTKIYCRTKFWKNFASRVSHVVMATVFSTPCLLKF